MYGIGDYGCHESLKRTPKALCICTVTKHRVCVLTTISQLASKDGADTNAGK